MRLLLRLVGLLLLAGAFAAVIVDATRSFLANAIELTPLGEGLARMSPDKVFHLRDLIGNHAFGDRVLAAVLALPIWLVLGVGGVLILLLARRRAPAFGHRRR